MKVKIGEIEVKRLKFKFSLSLVREKQSANDEKEKGITMLMTP